MKTVELLVALGANEGNRLQTCDAAIQRISNLPHTRLIAVSSFVETQAVRWADAEFDVESSGVAVPMRHSPRIISTERTSCLSNLGRSMVISQSSTTMGSTTSVSRLSDARITDEITQKTLYLNAVGRWETTLTLENFFDLLQTIETELGRVRSYRWASRRIDLDLLFYGNDMRRTARLWLPHPRLHLRRFVLEPAMEVAGDWRHPVLGETIAELKKRFDADAPITIRNLPFRKRKQFLEKIGALCDAYEGRLSGLNGQTALQWSDASLSAKGPVIDAAVFPTVLFARNECESRSREDEYVEMERNVIDGDGDWSNTILDALVAETFAAIQCRYADGR